MADKDLSVNISVGTTLDEKSVKETERKIQDILAKGVTVEVNTDSAKLQKAAERRAERGLPPRTPRGRITDVDFADIFKKNLFNSLKLNDADLKKGFKLALPSLDTADPFSGLGETLDVVTGQFTDIKKKIKAADSELSENASESSRIDFSGKISDELEVLKDLARDVNEFTKEIAKATNIDIFKLDYLKPGENQFEAEVSDLLSGFAGLDQDAKNAAKAFALIGDTLVPSAQTMIEAYKQSLQEASMLGVPVAAFKDKYAFKPRVGRGVPTGVDRTSLGDSKQSQRVQENFERQIISLAKNPDTSDATAKWMSSAISDIAEDIWAKTLDAMEQSAEYYSKREFKGGIDNPGFITKEESTDIGSGSNELGYWLEQIVSKFREFTLARGFEPGSEDQLIDFLRSNRETLSAQEEMAFPAIESGFTAIEQGLQNFTSNLDSGSAKLLEEQVVRNATILSDKKLGGGAQKEIKELTAALPEQVKQIKELGETAEQASQSVQEMESSVKDRKKLSSAYEMAQLDLDSTEDWVRVWQNLAQRVQKEGASADRVQSVNEEVERQLLKQAEAEKNLIELKAKLTAAEISAIESEQMQAAAPQMQDEAASAAKVQAANEEVERQLLKQAEAEKNLIELKAKLTAAEASQIQQTASEEPMAQLESGFDAWQKNFLDKLAKLGQIDEVAFDTEFNHNINQLITEAAVTVKNGMGELVDLFEMIHAPASANWKVDKDEYGEKRVEFQPGSREEVEEIAAIGNIPGGIGSTDPTENFIEFYEKIQKLSFVLKTLSDQGAVIVGSNAGETDLNTLGKAIERINKASAQIAPQLSTIEDFTPGVRTSEPNKIVAQAKDEAAKVLTASGASLSKMMVQILENFSELMTEQQKAMFRMGKKGLEVKVENLETGIEKWLPAHYAKVDNRIALAVKSVLDQLLPVESSQVRETKDYASKRAVEASKEEPRVPRRASDSGAGEPPQSGGIGSEEAANNAVKYFLAATQIAAIQAEMPKHEQKLALQALTKLQNQSEYKKLLEKEAALRADIADLEASGAGADVIRARRDDLNRTIVQGRELERQVFEQTKATARAGDVAKKYQNTAAQTVDTYIELEQSAKKAFSTQIRGQIQEQVSATKAVDQQTKSLINTWVTGRYALYDVGNAYAGVSRQLWMASRQIFNITQAFRSYETAFTSVERAIEPLAATFDGAVEESRSLKNAFIELSEQIPVSFEEISRIATLGAQMGVTASGVVDFTKTVAQFSSVTGVAADTVAQKFGRIAELANVDYSEFNNLGSAILFAGINAVATEPEIMTLSESIAAVSAQAGMLPSEIVGMATALASTGIQAEQARGVFTRVFADIDRAVSKGGESLDALASVAGISASQFEKAWGTEGASYDVFRAILGGLNSTEDLTAAFDKLNIVETREINTLTRLAKNLNVVDQANSDANASFEAGSFLANAFEKTVDNLDAKIQVFNNNVKSVAEALSGSMAPSLGAAIDLANGLLQSFKEIAKNPVAGWLTTVGLGVTAFGAAATLAVSGVAKLVAQIYAFRVAAINTANDATAITSIPRMFKQLTGFGGGLIEMRDSLKSIDPAVRGVITPATFSLFDDLDARKKKLLQTDNIYLTGSKARGAAAQAAARLEADSITQIVAARNREIAQIEMLTGIKDHERAKLLQDLGGRRIYIETINGETRALTANEVAQLRNTKSSLDVSEAKRKEAAERYKNLTIINTETRAASLAQRGVLGIGSRLLGIATGAGAILSVVSAVAGLFATVAANAEKAKINLLESGGGVASLRDAIKQDTLEYQKLTDAQKANSDQYITLTRNTREYTSELDPNAQAVALVTGVGKEFVQLNTMITDTLGDQTLALGKNTKEWMANAILQDENVKKMLDIDFQGLGLDLPSLFDQVLKTPDVNPITPILQSVGAEFNSLKEIVKSYEFDSDSIISEVQYENALSRMEQLSIKSAELANVLAIFGGVGTAVSEALDEAELYNVIRGLFGLTDATDDATDSANELEEGYKEVAEALRTVLDYASDLSGIFGRVVELEFGKQIAVDAITTGWQNLADSAKDAKDAIEDANNEIKDLTADRSILEYQLSVAERYGDEVRAAKIRAELAKVNEQIVDSEEKLAEAQSQASTELDGNSEAAIRNRSSLISMVGEYQSYIEMLAKLGKKQPELEKEAEKSKEQFLSQAKALGFTEDQLADYLDLFDDFAEVVTDAPRDVDIEVNLGLTAAQQAIDEFLAKDRSMGVDVKIDEIEDIDTRTYGQRTEDALQAMLDKIPLNADTMWGSYLKDLLNEIRSEKTRSDSRVALQGMWKNVGNDTSSMWGEYLAEQLRKGSRQAILEVANAGMASVGGTFSRKPPVPSYIYDYYRQMYSDALRLSTGGTVSGPGTGTSDSIPAMLSNGEFVIRASSVKSLGLDFLNHVNQSGSVAGYRTGGFVIPDRPSAKRPATKKPAANVKAAMASDKKAASKPVKLAGRKFDWGESYMNSLKLNKNNIPRGVVGTEGGMFANDIVSSVKNIKSGKATGWDALTLASIPLAFTGLTAFRNAGKAAGAGRAASTVSTPAAAKLKIADSRYSQEFVEAYRLSKKKPLTVFEGGTQDFSSLTSMGANVVKVTPQNLLREAASLNPLSLRNLRLKSMANNFDKNKIGKNEIKFLDNMTASIFKGTDSASDFSGLPTFIKSLAGNRSAANSIANQRQTLMSSVEDLRLRVKNGLPAPNNLDDVADPSKVSVIHSTSHPITRDKNGNIVLKPSGAYSQNPRASVHFTLEDVVKSHMFGSWGSDQKKIVTSLSSMMGKNNLPYNINSTDTWWMRNPGQSLKIPNASVISPYTDVAKYTEELKKRGLPASGNQARLITLDKKTKEVLHLVKEAYTAQDRIQLGEILGRVPSAGSETNAIEQFALKIAKEEIGTDTAVRNLEQWSTSDPVFERKIRNLADKLKVQRGIHAESPVIRLERTMFSGDGTSISGIDSIEALRFAALRGRFNARTLSTYTGPELSTGGYVTGPGTGTSDSIPARLSNGEFVISAGAVKNYGVDFFNSLNQQRMGFTPVSGGGMSGQQQGPTIVFLSPEDRQLLRQFGDRPVNLYADSTKIAEVANSGNTKMSRRGTR